MSRITTVEQLESLYGAPSEPSLVKVADRVTPEYRAILEASPFATLATVGPEGIDCSPRGDRAGFVRIADERTLMLPDRRGNNRVDSLRNIVRDPRVALLFLVPGYGITLRVNGLAHLSIDAGLLASFETEGRTPRSVLVVEIGEIYFQCSRAVLRSRLWEAEGHADARGLPSTGQILAAMTAGRMDGAEFDRAWAGRAAATMW